MSTLELAYARDERIAQQIVALNVRITCLSRQDYDRSRAFKQIRKHKKIMTFQKMTDVAFRIILLAFCAVEVLR